jgi:hypothetical protein
MKNSKILFRLAPVFLLLLLSGCTKDSKDPERSNQDTTSINAFFKAIPDWDIPEVEPLDDVYIEDIQITDANTDDTYNCSVFERKMTSTIRNFLSVGTNFGTIWPGAMIQGNSLKTGELQPINTNQKRAPITLTTDIALEKTSIIIEPNSVNAQQAIADFMLAANEFPEGRGAGTMSFLVEEATTFVQAMRQMGISAGFTEPESKVGMEGSLTVATDRSNSSHTVMAKYVQEMFTIRVADDLIGTPADFFNDDFTMSDLQDMETAGELGDDNIPLYIESVTYGRILLFSMQSETVASSNKLSTALEASMAEYAKVGGSLDDEHEEIFSTATYKIFSAGGDDGAANATIANLDWSKFFVSSEASEAVPISFVAKTIDGKKIVGLVHDTTFERRDDCSIEEFVAPPAPEVDYYEVTVEWTATDNTGLCFGGSGVLGSCNPQAYVKLEKDLAFTRLTALNGFKRTFIISPETDDPYFNFTVRSVTRLRMPWPYQPFTQKTASSSFNVTTLPTTRTFHHLLSNFAGSVKLTYTITTSTIYK